MPGRHGDKGDKGDSGPRGERGDTPNCPPLDVPAEYRGDAGQKGDTGPRGNKSNTLKAGGDKDILRFLPELHTYYNIHVYFILLFQYLYVFTTLSTGNS